MRYTDAGIEDFLEEIERDYSQSTATAAAPAATSTSIATSAPANPVIDSSLVSQSRPQSQRAVPERQSTLKPVTPTRKFTTDKTAGEGGHYLVAHEAYQGGGGGSNPPIGLTPRAGDVEASNRENSVQIEGSSGDLNMQRQTPAQDMTSNMIEINQGIRRHQEQQTQAALTDRVKRLSKASDSSDRDRFVRSLPPGSPTTEAFTEEPEGFMDVDTPQPRSESPNSSLPNHEQEVVRQIAHRVSQQLRDAQKRGDSTMDYHSLIAQEIEKEQKAGVLPTTPTGSRQNSVNKAFVESGSPVRPVTPQSRQTTMAEESFDRQVKVFRPPADDATPLSNQSKLTLRLYAMTLLVIERL